MSEGQEYREISDYVKESVIAAFSLSLMGSSYQRLGLEFLAYAVLLTALYLLLGWVGIVTPTLLRKYRRHAFMVCAVAGPVVAAARCPKLEIKPDATNRKARIT